MFPFGFYISVTKQGLPWLYLSVTKFYWLCLTLQWLNCTEFVWYFDCVPCLPNFLMNINYSPCTFFYYYYFYGIPITYNYLVVYIICLYKRLCCIFKWINDWLGNIFRWRIYTSLLYIKGKNILTWKCICIASHLLMR